MAIKTDTFEILVVNYKGKLFPADDFRGILGLANSQWPKKLKVWEVKRLSDNACYTVYDIVGKRRITEFNTGNAFDETYVYFDDCQPGVKLSELKEKIDL